jgi:ABC-2 type transport system ATP-binding protein
MTPIIDARELNRWYGIVMGLNNVSFTIPPGLTGLVGPNGAGKSTLLQIITGQMQPSSGTLTVFGERPWNNPKVLRRIGFCPEKEAVHQELRPTTWLHSLALVSGMTPQQATQRVEQILDKVKLARPAWKEPMAQFSKGMRQRVKLAQALMHDPDLLVLDEPMNGLDPIGRQEMVQILRDLAAHGASILISSHILAELEPICQGFLILNWGRVLASGSQQEIRTDMRDWSEELAVKCDDPEKLAGFLFRAGVLSGFDLDLAEGVLYLRVKHPASFYEQWARLLLESQVVIHEIRSQSLSLKQIFEKVTT